MNTLRISFLSLLLLSFLKLNGQDVGFYLNEMNTDAGIDADFNAVIDSIWQASNEDLIDSSNYLESVSFLYNYYDSATNAITRDKSELYGYFILLKHKDYATIINRFESKLNEYNHRAFTTISEIHRRSFIRLNNSDLKEYREHLLKQENAEASKDLRAFLDSIKELRPGEQSPDFTVTDLAGNTYTLNSLRGKVVLLDFWATWCGPCIKELPGIKQIHQKYSPNPDFIMIGISKDDDEMKLKNYVIKSDMLWPQVLDTNQEGKSSVHGGTMATLFKAKGIPKYFLIDKEGYIRYNSRIANNEFVPNRIIDRYLQKK